MLNEHWQQTPLAINDFDVPYPTVLHALSEMRAAAEAAGRPDVVLILDEVSFLAPQGRESFGSNLSAVLGAYLKFKLSGMPESVEWAAVKGALSHD